MLKKKKKNMGNKCLKAFFREGLIEAGCDEAGRGCLAGPVYAAAVILPPLFHLEILDDSKQMPEKSRVEARAFIEKEAIAWAVAWVDNLEIDKINILQASIQAMHKAIKKLQQTPQYLLVDGNYFIPYPGISHQTVVNGDGLYQPIAAASVLAKTHRDEYMKKIHEEYPGYSWNTNKGYATRQHKLAIKNLGLTPYHRKSFNSNFYQLEIPFDRE